MASTSSEVSSAARPPVCKIIDYGKYKYDQSKLKKENPKKTHRLKEVKFRVGVAEHDYMIKVTRAEKFLMDGDKTRIQLMFRGRQMAHKEIGFELMKRVAEDLEGVGDVDQQPRLSGRFISMSIHPHPEHMRKAKFKITTRLSSSTTKTITTRNSTKFEEDHDGDGEAKPKKKKEPEPEPEPEKPKEGHVAEPEDLIASYEEDTGRPKNKRG